MRATLGKGTFGRVVEMFDSEESKRVAVKVSGRSTNGAALLARDGGTAKGGCNGRGNAASGGAYGSLRWRANTALRQVVRAVEKYSREADIESDILMAVQASPPTTRPALRGSLLAVPARPCGAPPRPP